MASIQASTSKQEEGLFECVKKSLSTGFRRPLLHHLNADTAWLLQIAHPASRTEYYNILIDPWLQGSHIDLAAFFSLQTLKHEAAYPDIHAVKELIKRVDKLARRLTEERDTSSTNSHQEDTEGRIDLVAIHFDATDHCNKESLLQLDKTVPVLAQPNAAKLITSWKHFDTVVQMPHFLTSCPRSDTDWKSRHVAPLPSWLSISRFTTGFFDVKDLHSAVLFAFNLDNDQTPNKSACAEAIVYTPHGVVPSVLEPLKNVYPPIKINTLVHGLNAVTIGPLGLVNLGASNGLEVQQMLGARLWVPTHDEDNRDGGIVSWVQKNYPISVEGAVEEYVEKHEGAQRPNPPFTDVANGKSVALP